MNSGSSSPDLQELESAIEAGSLTQNERHARNVSHSTAPGLIDGSNPLWPAAALVGVSVLMTASIFLAFWFLYHVTETRRVETTMSQFQANLQELNAGISFDSRRRQLMLCIRDEIIRVNPRVSLRQAYEFARLLLEATEKYPSVDPLLFLSVGIVESGFDPKATSEADARGLYQIWPATGRLLARALEWEYTDEMLYDPARNTEVAALYLDVLFSTYHDEAMVLAEYNGGSVNAGYFRAQNARVAAETRDYVRKVSAVHEGLKEKFDPGIDAPSMDDLYRGLDRDGKSLLETSLAEPGT